MGAVAQQHDAGTVTAEICLSESHGWRRWRHGATALWFKGHVRKRGGDDLARDLDTLGAHIATDALEAWLCGLDGHFALVAQGTFGTLVAADRVRTIPLIWCRDGSGTVLISQNGAPLSHRLGLGPQDASPLSVSAVALAGFTIGDETLYPAIRQIGPGQYTLFSNGTPRMARYHQFRPWLPEAASDSALETQLLAATEEIIQVLIESAAGRPIALPVSAGLDSRLIAAGLKHFGHRDVLCFAYGQPGNHEAEASRAIAERLGYPWRFVPYTQARQRAAFASADYAAFLASADSLTGVHFPQDYLALTELLKDGWLPKDAVLVNGQSGDFISGNHIPAALAAPQKGSDPEPRRARIVDALMAKHFCQWGRGAVGDVNDTLRARLGEEIDAVGLPASSECDYGIYEWCEFQDRQSKYVVGGQRVYEHLGLDWRLPLWDQRYLDFWERAPLAAKTHQRLYRAMLTNANWGGVWRDIPVNRKTIKPAWVVPLRFAAKMAHAPLGKKRWREFERRYVQYWTSPLCNYALVPYGRVAGDARGHRSGVAWHIEAYLAGKSLGLDGLPRKAA